MRAAARLAHEFIVKDKDGGNLPRKTAVVMHGILVSCLLVSIL